jgi:hypothetical protein
MKTRFFHLAILLFFLGCTKEEITPREYPRVSTFDAVDITSDGVTFKGEITFSSVDIKDHGFVWSDVLGPLVSTANKISLGTRSGTGQFDAKCDRSLEEGKKYFMRAYAVSDDFVVYGNTIEFISLGGKAPLVKDFYPTIGTWSDSVTIVGENFGEQNRTNIVKFGQSTATVIRSTKDTLLAIVPGDLATKLSKVSVSLSGNSSSVAKEFQLISPTITSVTPGIGLQGTKVTINGEYLLSVSTKVFFGDTQATVLNWSSKKIECLVPNVPNGEVLLKVQTGTGGLFATSPFKVQPEHLPELYQIQPALAKAFTTIKLIGDHFATEPGQTTVKFGNVDAQVLSVSKTEIEVVVPDPDTRTPAITVTSYGSSVSIDGFTLKPPVINDFSPHRGVPGGELLISITDAAGSHLKVFLDEVELPIQSIYNNQIYTQIPTDLSTHEGTLKVFFYDQEFVLNEQFKAPWIMLEDFPGIDLSASQCIVNNNNAYVLMAGPPGQSNQIWKFDGSQWTRLNDFLDGDRSITVSFATSNKGYAGAGWQGTTQMKDLWEYDFGADAWTKQSDITLPNYPNTGFAVGNEGFAFNVVDHPDQPDLWSYNVVDDSWSLKSAAPAGETGYAIPFVIGSSAYLIHSGVSFWRYTPSTNQWTVRSLPPVNPSFAFAIGSYGYAGDNNYFFKYNSTTNSWVAEINPYIYGSIPNRSFSINGKGYILGPAQYGYDNYVYEYDPNY